MWRGWFFSVNFRAIASSFFIFLDFTSSHLLFICFSTLHIVGSLPFKLPSIITPLSRVTTYPFNPMYKAIYRGPLCGSFWLIKTEDEKLQRLIWIEIIDLDLVVVYSARCARVCVLKLTFYNTVSKVNTLAQKNKRSHENASKENNVN